MEKNKKPIADIRFLLANERTFLAWLRTSIALVAGGFVISHFSSKLALQRLLSIFIIALGGSVAVIGYFRFKATQRAIHEDKPLLHRNSPSIQTVGIALVSIAFMAAALYTSR